MPQETDFAQASNEGAAAELTALLAAGAALNGAKLHLYKAPFAPTPANVGADYTAAECDFVGYTPQAVTYSAIGNDANNTPTALSNRVFFQMTDNSKPNLVGGAWLSQDITGPPATVKTIKYYPFAAPKNLTDALDFLGVVIAVQDPKGSGYAIVDY